MNNVHEGDHADVRTTRKNEKQGLNYPHGFPDETLRHERGERNA